MSIKVKILKENKKANIEESMLDPNTLMMIAGALGVGVPLLKAMFSGGGTEGDLEKVRDQINAKVAKADKLSGSSMPSGNSDAHQKLAAMKADRAQMAIGEDDLKTYVDMMNRINRGEGTSENPKLLTLIDKYGKEELASAAADMLYESFKRYLA